MNLAEATAALEELAGGRDGPGQFRLEVGERVAHVRIDHREARGAVTLAMMVQLARAVATLQEWRGSLIVLSGSDPDVFCSGGHLGEVSRAVDSPEAATRMSRSMMAVLDALLELPAVSVAAIDGLAVGGGAELTTACDYRVAGPGARLRFVHARLGIAPGWGGAGRLVRLLGRRRALRVLTDARPISPGEASSLGLVDHKCPGSAVDGTLRWFEELVQLPPVAVRAIKRQVVAAAPARRDAAAEARIFSEVWGGPEHQAALERLERHRK